MYAIFKTGGKQYKVEAGDVIKVEKLEGEAGDTVNLGNVLAFSDEKGLVVGTPYLEAATVNAKIVETGKGEKIIIFKFKAKKDYRNKKGHRQPYTEIEIENFTVGGKTVGKAPEKKEPKAKEEIEEVEAEVVEEAPEEVVEEKDAVEETVEAVEEEPVAEAEEDKAE